MTIRLRESCRSLGWLAIWLTVAIAPAILAAQEPPAPPALVLGSGSGTAVQTGTKTYHGLLVRELMRQSLLLAAREELQLHIRDVTIGEAAAAEANWELACSPGNPNLLELLRGQAPSQVSVWQHPMQLPGDSLKYDVLLDGMEKYSRSIFPKVLKEQLPAEVFIRRVAGESGPFEIDSTLLEEVFLVPQFAVVRRAQAVVPEHQMVPLRLESLIRGNANLGLLTECYWHPAHVGYKARALLYAQRWVAREPTSAQAVYCRAYAWHLAGNNALALADLEQGKKLSEGKPEPTWAPLIQDACHYRLTKLSAYPSNHPHFKLARLLAAVTASRTNEPERAKNIAFLQRRETLAPRLFEGWYELDQEDERDDVWEMASGHFGASLYDRLTAIPLLPGQAQAIAKRNSEQPAQGSSAEELASRAALVATLFDSKNEIPSVEPNNRALGVLIQQATFLHAWGGGFDLDEDVIYTPLAECLKSHPYASLLKSRSAKTIKDVISQLDFDQLQYKERRLFNLFRYLDRDALSLTFAAAERHRDSTTADYLPRLPWRHPKAAVKIPWQAGDLAMVRLVLEVDPHHPYARTVLIEGDRKSITPQQFSAWAETAADHRKLAAALSLEFERDNNLVDAEKLLVDTVKIHDDFESYQNLALFYDFNQQREKWLATWTEWLDRNPEGEQRPGLLASLAETMIRERNLVAAEKYVLEAVEKNNVQALLAAGAVYEVKEDWAKAEQFYHAASKSQVTYEHEWYLFCRRVGKGDEAAAKKLAEGYFTEFVHRDRARRNVFGVSSTRADLFDFHKGGTFGAALGRPLEAISLFQEQFTRTPDPALGLHAALMAIELKQPETRDRLIQRVVDDSLKYRSDDGHVGPLIVLGQEIQKDLKRGAGDTKIDLEIARDFAKRMSGNRRTDFDYLLGRWYEICGDKENAKAAYLHCLAQPTIRHNSRTLAGIGLRRLGGGPADYRERFLPKVEKEEKGE